LGQALTRFYRPSAGAILLALGEGGRHALHTLAGYEIARRAKVARTFQNIRLFAGMTVLENLMVVQHNMLMPSVVNGLVAVFGLGGHLQAERRAIDKARMWLEAVGLMGQADDPTGSLPYGAQRRLAIARAMCGLPCCSAWTSRPRDSIRARARSFPY
jgi:branched-chain amino acid transport system ATP-binding protein